MQVPFHAVEIVLKLINDFFMGEAQVKSQNILSPTFWVPASGVDSIFFRVPGVLCRRYIYLVLCGTNGWYLHFETYGLEPIWPIGNYNSEQIHSDILPFETLGSKLNDLVIDGDHSDVVSNCGSDQSVYHPHFENWIESMRMRSARKKVRRAIYMVQVVFHFFNL